MSPDEAAGGEGSGGPPPQTTTGWPQGSSPPQASLRGRPCGDSFPDEDIRGRESGGYSYERGHGITRRPKPTSPSADKVARTSVGYAVADDAATGSGVTARCRGRGHGMARGIIASAGGQGRADGFGRCCRVHSCGWGREGADAVATEEATGRPRVFASADMSARTAVGTNSLTRLSGEVEAEAAALDEVAGLPRETAPQRTRLRERPWGMSPRFAAGGEGEPAAEDVATRGPRGSSPQKASLRGRPRGPSPQTKVGGGGCGSWR